MVLSALHLLLFMQKTKNKKHGGGGRASQPSTWATRVASSIRGRKEAAETRLWAPPPTRACFEGGGASTNWQGDWVSRPPDEENEGGERAAHVRGLLRQVPPPAPPGGRQGRPEPCPRVARSCVEGLGPPGRLSGRGPAWGAGRARGGTHSSSPDPRVARRRASGRAGPRCSVAARP